MIIIHIQFFQTNTSIAQVDQLQKNTTYAITATIFNGRSEYRQLQQTQYFKTLEHDDYVPDKISNDTIRLYFTWKQDTSALSTTIKWKSAAGEIMRN